MAAPTKTDFALLLPIVARGGMTAEDLNEDMVSAALAAGAIVESYGFLYIAGSRAAGAAGY